MPNFVPSDKIAVTNPTQVRAVYANNVGAAATLTDFRLFFTELGADPAGDEPRQTQEIRSIVVLPIAAAANLIQVLQQVQATQPEMQKLAMEEAVSRSAK